VQPVLSLAITRWLSIGGGVTLLADAAGNGIDFDVGVYGGEKVGRARLDASLPLRIAPVLGVLVEPIPGFRIGASYRGEIDLGLKLDVVANVDIAGAVTGDTKISIRALDHYTPRKVSLGLAYDVIPSLTLMADATYLNWSAFKGGAPDLEILVALGISPALRKATYPENPFRDVVIPRVAGEYRHSIGEHVGLSGRLGFSYERSPVPDQTNLINLADNDQVVITAGFGVALSRITSVLAKPLTIDIGAGWHQLIERTIEKDPRLFPGSTFTSSGRIVHLSATLGARF
jgi:long-subunit fatty acid transport protein